MPSRYTSAVDDVAAEGERGQDGRLGRGVVAVDVGRRVGLGQAELLGLAQDLVVGRALLLHAGEDVIGGAVHDPHDALDLLAGERLAQRPDHWDGAGDGRLVEKVHPGGRGHLGQLRAGDGEEGLVAGDDGLASAQRRLDQLVGRVQAADQLDHDVDVVTRHQGGGIRADQPGVDGVRPGLLRVGHGDADELQPDARAGRDVVDASEEYLGQGATDVPAAEQGDPDRRRGMRRVERFLFPGRGRAGPAPEPGGARGRRLRTLATRYRVPAGGPA